MFSIACLGAVMHNVSWWMASFSQVRSASSLLITYFYWPWSGRIRYSSSWVRYPHVWFVCGHVGSGNTMHASYIVKSSGQVAPYLTSVCNVSCNVSLVPKNVSIASGQVDACTLATSCSVAIVLLWTHTHCANCVYLTGNSSEIHCD